MLRNLLRALTLCLVLGIGFIALPAQSTAHAAPSTTKVAAASVTIGIVGAGGGVYWRSQPDWNTPVQKPNFGVYTGEQVALSCYAWGTLTP